jgi:glycosyltransferase involved in cell wall biosynthesis
MSTILYVITDLELGGVPLHLFHLARAARQHGFTLSVASLAPAGPVAEMLRGDGIEVDSCEGRGGRDWRVLSRLAAIMRRRRPEVVHALLFHANVAARWAGRRAGIPRERILCEIQTVEVERRWHLLVDRFTHRGCRLTIGNSPSVITHLHEEARIPLDRLRLVRGGIDVARIDAAGPATREDLVPGGTGAAPVAPCGTGVSPVASCGTGVPPVHPTTTPIILWVGRLDPVKGLEFLIPAFEGLPAELHAHLVLVGGGDLRPRIEADVAARGLAGRVHLLGPRRDVPSLLKACDVFAFPSRTEGLPNALLEAMAAGRAIVTTDVPGCRDLIRDDVNGLVVPYGDEASLRAALLTLLTDRARASRLAAEARRSAAEDWRIADTYEAYIGVYREVL